MKVTKEKAGENRGAVVQTASRLFREYGFHGINVAGLMAGAGLTHGGFYRQFASKEALLAEASEAAFAEVTHLFKKIVKKPSDMLCYAKGYLSKKYEFFCPVVTMGADVSRQEPIVQKHFAKGLRELLGASGAEISSEAWNKHTAQCATLFGTLLMAKAVRHADSELADAITEAAIKQLEQIC